jgi:hypothetical protein
MRARLLAPLLALVFAAACSGGDDHGPVATNVLLNPTVAPSPTPVAPPLTLDDVFPPRDLSALHLDPSRVRTVITTGDVIPARHVDVTIRRMNDDFMYPVAATKDITRDADITVINLEAPLIADCPYHDEGFTFCGRPGFVPSLVAAGVDVVTMENNHITNYGPDGFNETAHHLEDAGIKWADRDTPAIVDVRGLKFGFVAFNGVGEAIDRAAMQAKIAGLRPKVDVLAVAFHWGKEYVSQPEVAPGVADDQPTEIAHLAVDAGADLVIGNHPHWVQGVEIYKGKYIAYALGNFIFDQMWSYDTRLSVVGKYTFYDKQLIGVRYMPMLIENFAQPRPLEGAEGQAVLDGMAQASRVIAGLATPDPARTEPP